MKTWFDFVHRWFGSEYLLTVYFAGAYYQTKIKKQYRLRSIKKLTNTHIRGITTDGNDWEIRSTQPFDYRLEQLS